MSSLPIVLIRFGEPVIPVRHAVGDYSLWFQRAISEPLGLVDMRDETEELPEAAGYIIMGSPVSVYEPHPWLPRALDTARTLLEGKVPTLGVCFGHQLFTVAAGGSVERNERGVEVGTVDVDLHDHAAEDPLFGHFAQGMRINASHDDTVTKLPAGPTILGTSQLDPHQVLRWGEQVWSVQFHPEMRQAETRLAVRWRSPRITAEGRDPQQVVDSVEEAHDGLDLLRNFVRLVRGQ